MERMERISKVFKHKIAFAKLEKKLTNRNTFVSLTHDLDKLLALLFLWFVSVKKIRKLHKKKAKHHQYENFTNSKIIYEKVLDYECARYTKKKSLMTAIEYINYKFDGDYLIRYLLLQQCRKFGLIK